MRKTRSTAAELRDDIDRGLTGDKVAVEDPATAPLGTDDEAAGISATPETIGEVRERELQTGALVRASEHSRNAGEANGAIPWLLVAAFLLSALAMVWLAAELI